jgi:5-hmdU DNA kinase, helical domain
MVALADPDARSIAAVRPSRGLADPKPSFRLPDGTTVKTTPVFDLYWRFAFERQEIFHRRLTGAPWPWTDDPILRTYRFTNAYRASDRVSQFLIRHVVYGGEQSAAEVFFRTILFKLFNRIETWALLRDRLGPLTWKTFRFEHYDAVLDAALRDGQRLYSPAYIMPNPAFGARRKHSNHLLLLDHMMKADAPGKIAGAKSLSEVFQILRSFPSVGDFLAFQYAVDLNYSDLTQFTEMDFVVAGPGARSGIRKAFAEPVALSDEQIIREVTAAAEREFGQRGLQFRTLWGRRLQLIDCQNLFCEIDKYSRVAYPQISGNGRSRIKRKFEAAGTPPSQWYPPKWGLPLPASESRSHLATSNRTS